MGGGGCCWYDPNKVSGEVSSPLGLSLLDCDCCVADGFTDNDGEG